MGSRLIPRSCCQSKRPVSSPFGNFTNSLRVSTFPVSNTTSPSQTSRALSETPFHLALAMQEDCTNYLRGRMERHRSLVEIHSGCSFLTLKPLACRDLSSSLEALYMPLSPPLETARRPESDIILRGPIQTTYSMVMRRYCRLVL